MYSIGSPTDAFSGATKSTPPALMFIVSPKLFTGMKFFRTTSTGNLRSNRLLLRWSFTGYLNLVPNCLQGQGALAYFVATVLIVHKFPNPHG